jgi:hypothetical protein
MAALVFGTLLLAAPVQAGPAVIVQGGRSRYVIVKPDAATLANDYAAKELQGFLRQMTGAELPVVAEARAGGRPAFLVGPCRRSLRAGLGESARQLAADGVMIRSLGRDVALLGSNERGTVYSVYAFLERYLGVRFLAWDCTILPERRDLRLPDMDYRYAPPFLYRETLYFNSFPREIAARQRLNGPSTKCDAATGGKIDFYPYVHSFRLLVPEQDYFKGHPEYFGLQGGKRVAGTVHAQLCLSNPDVRRIATQTVLNWIREHPDVPIFDVSQNDGNGPCECEQCSAIVQAEGSQHGPILRFVNAIADAVAEKYPDKWIETLAYAYSVVPPRVTRPRDNVIIRLCHVGCFFHGFEQCKQGGDLAGWVDQWSRLSRRVFIWHYATDFGHYLAPNPNLAGLAKDIRFYAAHGVNGLMVQCDYQGPGGELAELRQYVAAELMWDPAQDPGQLREEFCHGYYGSAAPQVLDFLRRMDQLGAGPAHVFAVWDPQTVVSPPFAREALELLGAARAAANPTVRNRVNKLMLPFWYTSLLDPGRYGLSGAQAAAAWQEARQTLQDNGINFIRESGAPDGDAPGWILEMNARFAPAPTR